MCNNPSCRYFAVITCEISKKTHTIKQLYTVVYAAHPVSKSQPGNYTIKTFNYNTCVNVDAKEVVIKLICPKCNWKSRKACLQSSPEIKCWYFLDGVVLLMNLRRSSLGENFHWHSQCFFGLLTLFCQSAEILRSRCLQRNLGRYLALLKTPCAAFFTSWSTFSLGAKLTWSGTQWTCKFIIPLCLPIHCLLSAIAASLSLQLIEPSCFLWRFFANWWMILRIYWLGCKHWLSRALITTWLSEPKIVEWVNLELILLNRWGPSQGLLPLPCRQCTPSFLAWCQW